MRAAVFVAVVLCAVAVSAQPKPASAKGGAPLQAKMASIRPTTVPRASPNQSCTAAYNGATVTGTCWVPATCKKHSGQGLVAVTAQAPGGKCPAGQSCCVVGLKPPAPATPVAPAPVKPPAPVQPATPAAPQVPASAPAAPQGAAPVPAVPWGADKCSPNTGKPGRYTCMRCVNTYDKYELRCHYSTATGTCYGAGTRYGSEGYAYERLVREKWVDKPGDCDRL